MVGVLNEQQGNVRRLISNGATVLGTLGVALGRSYRR